MNVYRYRFVCGNNNNKIYLYLLWIFKCDEIYVLMDLHIFPLTDEQAVATFRDIFKVISINFDKEYVI